MKKGTLTKALSGAFALLLLSISTMPATVSSVSLDTSVNHKTISNYIDPHSIFDIPFLYEEEEEKNFTERYETLFDLFYCFHQTFNKDRLADKSYFADSKTCPFGNTTNLPVYLTKKSLLI
jgi:hypothetical protein